MESAQLSQPSSKALPAGYYIVRKDKKLFSVGWFDAGTINDLRNMKCYDIQPASAQETGKIEATADRINKNEWYQTGTNKSPDSESGREKAAIKKRIIDKWLVLRDVKAVWLELYPATRRQLKLKTVEEIVKTWRKKNETDC